ncbi:MAG: hypothetical protein ACTSRA_11380 [Promethearchaeota archaeon]
MHREHLINLDFSVIEKIDRIHELEWVFEEIKIQFPVKSRSLGKSSLQHSLAMLQHLLEMLVRLRSGPELSENIKLAHQINQLKTMIRNIEKKLTKL